MKFVVFFRASLTFRISTIRVFHVIVCFLIHFLFHNITIENEMNYEKWPNETIVTKCLTLSHFKFHDDFFLSWKQQNFFVSYYHFSFYSYSGDHVTWMVEFWNEKEEISSKKKRMNQISMNHLQIFHSFICIHRCYSFYFIWSLNLIIEWWIMNMSVDIKITIHMHYCFGAYILVTFNSN